MVEVASAYVTLMPSMKGFKRDLDRQMRGVADGPAGREGKRAGGKMGSGMAGAAGGALRKAIAPLAMAAGAVGVGSFFKGAVSAASDRQQARGATEAIWGPLEKEMNDRARKAAQSIGLSETAYMEASNLIGTQLKNRGFEGDELLKKTDQLMTRAADMSAMFGGTTKDATDALNAVLRGEYEQIEKYGVSLKQSEINAEMQKRGLDGLTGEQKKYAEAQVATDLVLQQTAVSAGTFAKESDTLAGAQQRARAQFDNLKATIGEAFLPVLTSAFGYLNDTVLPIVTGFVEGMRDGTGAGGQFADGLSWLREKAVAAFGWIQENVTPILEAAFGYVRDEVIPIIQNFITEFQNGEGAGGRVRDMLTRLWEGFMVIVGIVRDTVIPIIMDLWDIFQTNVLPVLSQVWDFIVNTLVPDVVEVFENNIIPAFNSVADAISEFWTEVGEPVLTAFWGFVNDQIMPLLVSLYEDGVKPTFEMIGDIIETVWTEVVEPVFTELGDAPDRIRSRWDSAMFGIETVWNKLKQIAAKPIVAVIEFVNTGLIGSINKVLEWAGVGTIPLVPIPAPLHNAAMGYGATRQAAGRTAGRTGQVMLASGGILPGYSPGKDDHFFYGDKFNLALAGGEAIMRPEWTRAMGPDFIEEMNAAARRGGIYGVRNAMRDYGFANGGIFGGRQGDGAGLWETLKGWGGKIIGGIADFLEDPLGFIRNLFSGVADRLRENPFFNLGSALVSKMIKSVPDKVKELMGFSGNATGAGPGRAGPGLAWPAIWALVKGAAPEAVLTSAFRPGARTAGYGNLSMHALGRAIDIAPASMATYRKVMNLLPWTEAIFTPAGPLQKRNGSFYTERNPKTMADHRDHIHLAYERGGITPKLYDKGGWLQPGVSLVANKTDKPEAVLTDAQLKSMGGDTYVTVNGVPMDTAGQTADEILYQMRRVSHGKYAARR